jgi:hypothetical protein
MLTRRERKKRKSEDTLNGEKKMLMIYKHFVVGGTRRWEHFGTQLELLSRARHVSTDL